ncbi:MAG: S-adenosyl-l-methionine hydroxide adenosyltransferase family protein, partial [Sedimentisphaerales bacterium]
MIVLLTDFGQSEYVGVMKGVIYSINSDAKIVDLCHDIQPQNIIEASWLLKNNYKYFPKGAVFCCVVDPGVGTERKALAVKTDNYYFVAPDNGLLWETLKKQRVVDIRQIPVPEDTSRTFHGRDVFAKVAANINKGNFNDLGEKVKEIEKLELYQKEGEGIIVRIDRFGNIITNLPKQDNKDKYSVQ